MDSRGAAVGDTVSVAVTGFTSPAPVAVAVLVTSPSALRGAAAVGAASYAITALPPAGTVMPVKTRGGPAVTVGAVCKTPFW